jgi:murein DD-endopeptidase MepM/ murein hydrolase activator NlpD
MQKNSRFFTFLFTKKSDSRIYIKRVEVSKRLLQNSLITLALIFGITLFGSGIYGIFSISGSIDPFLAKTAVEGITAQAALSHSHQPASIDYSRPAESDRFSYSSGGPVSPDIASAEEVEIENQLRLIETTSDPLTLPTMWAVSGRINNEFGFRRNPFGGRTYEFHSGMDINGDRGDPIIVPANGTVTKAGWHGGYGNLVEIDHGNGLTTRYGHLSKIEVRVGDELTRGQLMGYVGSTGRSTGPHLHYELRLGERAINPRRFLPPEPIDIN